MLLIAYLLLPAACLFAAGPEYSASSILNAASNRSGPLAPNTIVSLYGKDLSYVTASAGRQDMAGGYLPFRLSLAGVQVSINNVPAGLFYVSPTQINFLISTFNIPGPVRIRVTREGRAGPEAVLTLGEVAPALFQRDPDYAVAVRPDGSAVDRGNPARPGEIVVLYATGLGRTRPEPPDRGIPAAAAPLVRFGELRVVIAGTDVPSGSVLYAGVAPGFAGLYQINLRLPDTLPADPEIRLGFADELSPPDVRLPVQQGTDPASAGNL